MHLRHHFRVTLTSTFFTPVLFLCCPSFALGQDWPQFRGAFGNGIAPEQPVPVQWSTSNNLAWKAAVPGFGWSQPVVVRNRIFMTSASGSPLARPRVFSEGVEDPHTINGAKAKAPNTRITWELCCVDLATGQPLWHRIVAQGTPKFPVHPSNTYASETPAADESAVYLYFGTAGVLTSFTHQGQFRWERVFGPSRQLENYGTGSSLRLHAGSLYVQCFGEEEAFLVCLDTMNGREKWRVTRDKPGTSWGTPLLWQTAGRAELVLMGPSLLSSHDPETGRELWRGEGIPLPSMTSACTDADHLYFGCRDPARGGPLHALKAPLSGRVQLSESKASSGNEAWLTPNAAPGMPSPIASAGCVFVINGTILACFDAATGREHYKERLPGFRAVIASPLAVGRKLFVQDESGSALTLLAGPQFQVLGRSKLDDVFWASPAVAQGALLLRGVDFLYCARAVSSL